MTEFLTNDIETNSFMGLITNKRGKTPRKNFVKIESWSILRNLVIVATILITVMVAGSISQQKVEFARYSSALI